VLKVDHFEVPLAKAEYLLNYQVEPGAGGDKRRFWREVMGFQSAELLRSVLLAKVSHDLLQSSGQYAFGDLYEAIILVTGPLERSCLVRTVWIVLFGQETARFVTAYPVRQKK
jgi:hypothetical protein